MLYLITRIRAELCNSPYRIRGWIYARFFKSAGRNVRIGRGVLIRGFRQIVCGNNLFIDREADFHCRVGGLIQIGNHVGIGRNNVFFCKKKISIEDEVLFGPYVQVYDSDHGYRDLEVPINAQPFFSKGEGIFIGAETWIEAGVVILSGSRIGKHCVIGSNSVVNSHIPDYSVVVGNPAVVVKYYDFKRKEWVKKDHTTI